MKIELDKYYTPIEKSQELIEFTLDFIGRDKIDTIIEPSAGNGSFSNYLFNTYSSSFKIHAFDIKPEENRIKEQDFLKLHNFRYNDKCLIIGNPPFGIKGTLLLSFYKKSIKLGKYIAFILPISQYKKSNRMSDFNLIYSKDLGELIYSNIKLNCCYIYKNEYKINKKHTKIEGINIIDYRRTITDISSINPNFDYSICAFGMVGKIPNYIGQFVNEFYFYINHPLKDKILNILKTSNWYEISKGISNTHNLSKSKIMNTLIEQLPELKSINKNNDKFVF